MKIIQLISGLGNGGAEKFVIELSNELSKEHSVLLCSFRSVEDWMIFPKLLNDDTRLISLKKKGGFDLNIYRKLYLLFKSEKPDVIHFHLDACMKYVLPLKIFFPSVQFVYTIHSSFNTDKIALFKKLNKIKFLSTKVKYVCISQPIFEDFKKALPAFEFILITNGIKRMDASPALSKVKEEVLSYTTSDKTKIFLIVGNYSEPKNFSLIVDVFARFYDEKKDVILLMIGNDSTSDQAEWKKIEAQKSANIFMLGLKSNVQDYMHVADAYCLCSTFEGLPISILEAYSIGKPVLSTPAGGVPGILKDKLNGLLTADYTPGAYYQMVSDFLNIPENDINRIKEKNISDFNNYYTIKKTSESYLLNFKN